MKKFSFNLEKVLNLRKNREEEAKIELGKAVGALSQIENNIKMTAQSRVHAARQRFTSVMTDNGGGALEMLAWDNYINRLDLETERLLRQAAQAELIVEEKREAYIAASREFKVIDKLREKREKEYRREALSAETRELDDLPRRHGV